MVGVCTLPKKVFLERTETIKDIEIQLYIFFNFADVIIYIN